MVLSSARWSKLVVQLALKYHMDLFSRNSRRVIFLGHPVNNLQEPTSARTSRSRRGLRRSNLSLNPPTWHFFFFQKLTLTARGPVGSAQPHSVPPAPYLPHCAQTPANTNTNTNKNSNTSTSTMYILFLNAWSVKANIKTKNGKTRYYNNLQKCAIELLCFHLS